MSTHIDLWDYSLIVYAKADVESCCLELQDEFGLNVNILLLSCWLAEADIEVGEVDLNSLLTQAENWQRLIVKPLRDSRRALRSYSDRPSQNLRDQVKKAELDAERIQQLQIQSALPSAERQVGSEEDYGKRADQLLQLYVQTAGLAPNNALQASLLRFRQAVFSTN